MPDYVQLATVLPVYCFGCYVTGGRLYSSNENRSPVHQLCVDMHHRIMLLGGEESVEVHATGPMGSAEWAILRILALKIRRFCACSQS